MGTPRGQSRADASAMDGSLVRSVAWTGVIKWSVQLFTWISTFVVARLLTAEDYGLLAMAAVFVGFVSLVSEFGLSMTVVTIRDLTRVQLAQLNGLAVLVGIAAMSLAWLFAAPLAGFYDTPRVAPIVVALSFTFLITSFKIIPGALLQRELEFKKLALIEGAQGALQASTTITLAWLGMSYWALVAGIIAGNSAGVILILLYRRHALLWPRWRTLQQSLTFTRHQLTGNLAWYAYSTSDMVIAGKLLGVGGVGLYSFAHTLARSLPEKITSLVVKVTPAFFSAVQDDVHALRRYVLRLTEYLALLTFPALSGIALIAGDLLALIGPQWAGAVIPLRILAVFAAYESVMQLLSRALTVKRETRFLMLDSLALAVLFPVAFVIGARWGPTGIAATWLVLHPLTRVPMIRLACRRMEVEWWRYLASYWPAVSASLCMVTVLLLLQHATPQWSPVARLALQIPCGGVAYILAVMTLHRSRAHALAQTVRSAWASRA